MKKFLGLVLAGAVCFAVTAKASAQDYMGPKFRISVSGITVSDLSKFNTKTSGYGGGLAYSVMPSDKSDIRLNASYFTSSDWTAWTYGADYVWKFGTPMETGAAKTAFYAGLGIDGINAKGKASGSGSESSFGGDIVAGVDINTNWNVELKYTITGDTTNAFGSGQSLKLSNFQYSVGYSF